MVLLLGMISKAVLVHEHNTYVNIVLIECAAKIKTGALKNDRAKSARSYPHHNSPNQTLHKLLAKDTLVRLRTPE